MVVQSKEGMERLARCTRDFGALTAVIVCADTSEAWTRKYDGKNISDIDASIVTDHMMLAAASLGLDTLWICMFKPEAVREEFALPANVEPVNILLIGYGDGLAADPNRHDTCANRSPRRSSTRGFETKKRIAGRSSFYHYFAYRRKVVRHDSPGSMARNPSAAGSAALGAFVVHVCGSGQQ